LEKEQQSSNVFDMVHILFEQKVFISSVMGITLTCGLLFCAFFTPISQSSIDFEQHHIPPNIKEKEVYLDFKNLYLDKNSFLAWKSQAKKVTLRLGDLSFYKNEGPFISKISKKHRKINLQFKNGTPYISVLSDDEAYLEEVFSYVTFVNKSLELEYKNLAEAGLEFAKENKMDLDVLPYLTYLHKAKELNTFPFKLRGPSKPEIMFPRPPQIILLSLVFGLALSITLLFLRKEWTHSRFNKS